MKITIDNVRINNEWDYQRGQYLLKMQGLSGGILNYHQCEYLEKEITLFMWHEIHKYFPQINDFCDHETGHLNKCEDTKHNTNIICVHGHFYMQYIIESTHHTWCWDSIDLDAYRFVFNNEGYLRKLFEAIENKNRNRQMDDRRYKSPVYSLSEHISYKPLNEYGTELKPYMLWSKEYYKPIFEY